MKAKNILLVDDDAIFRSLLTRCVNDMGHDAKSFGTWLEAQDWLTRNEPDLIVLDYKLPDADSEKLLAELASRFPVVVLTGYGSIKNAVSVIQAGAADYLTKPVGLDEFRFAIGRVLENAALRAQCEYYRTLIAQRQAGILIGKGPAMQEVNRLIAAVAPTDATVLIQGESGSGKEVVAQALHRQSLRRDEALTTLDCSSFQEALFESELFGHERGAFTGAERQKKGMVEEAGSGTLFLDEIGEISPAIQAKLLRVLETGTYRRLGGTKTLQANVRFITATNRNLSEASRAGDFRTDLYYRLSSFVITVPPLRERREDIGLLAQHFIEKFSKARKPLLSAAAYDILLAHDWPGNVRELRNALERAMILCAGAPTIEASHLAFLTQTLGPAGYVLQFPENPTLEEVERLYFLETLNRHAGNRAQVAKALGVSERQVYRLIRKYESLIPHFL